MYKDILLKDEYSFLKSNKHLGDNIQLLALGGSHAYGMNKEGSDLDIRGMSLNSKSEILLGDDFEQVEDRGTDTVIYSSNKLIKLLTDCNPNVIEILGCRPEHYLHIGKVGKLLLDNKRLFLSKVCIYTFGGYATSQLRRLENKSARSLQQSEFEAHILESIENARFSFKERYFPMEDDSVNLYIDDSTQDSLDSEIFMDLNLHKYPLRDWVDMWSEMKSIVRSYNKIGKRNESAISHGKLGKHMAHLLRLYMMCIDILEKEEIITYRENEHDLLMKVRNGEFLDSNSQPTSDFYDILNNYKKRFDYAKENTSLPDVPDRKSIEDFKIYINDGIVKGELL